MDEQCIDFELPPELEFEYHQFVQGIELVDRAEAITLAKEAFRYALSLKDMFRQLSKPPKWEKRASRRKELHIFVEHRYPKLETRNKPQEIKALETRFNAIREQLRVENLLLERLEAFDCGDRLKRSVISRIEFLQKGIDQTLIDASVWCFHHRYNLHTEAPATGGFEMWVTPTGDDHETKA